MFTLSRMYSRKLIAFIILTKIPIKPANSEDTERNSEGSFHPQFGDQLTSCEDFARNAKFNPYSVMDDYWFTFYFWAPSITPIVIKFLTPTAKELDFLRTFLDRQVKSPINWNTTIILVQDFTDKYFTVLFKRGEEINSPLYWMYHYHEVPEKEELMSPIDIVIKQTADNKYLGFMQCASDIVYAMSRKRDVPPQSLLQEAASKIGYHGRGGKSYLYQGHHWLPTPEMKEKVYWMTPRQRAKEGLDHMWD